MACLQLAATAIASLAFARGRASTAHRLSTVRSADLVVVIDKGSVRSQCQTLVHSRGVAGAVLCGAVSCVCCVCACVIGLVEYGVCARTAYPHSGVTQVVEQGTHHELLR